MSRSARLDLLFLVLVSAPAAVFIFKAVFPEAALYTAVFTEKPLLYLGSLTKLLFLFLSAFFAFRSASRFERDNPIRPAWMLLAAGLLAFFLGQLSLAPYQLFLDTPTPFPSVGDLFFLLSYVFLAAALVVFLSAYEKTGFPIGSPAERWGIAAGVFLLCVVLGYAILKPIVVAPAPALERFLNVAYPSLDFVLLVPTCVLLRITLRLRGGQVGKVWLMLLTGFVLLSVGDILFAYLSSLGLEQFDPFVDAMYILSYGCLARGAVCQYELLTS